MYLRLENGSDHRSTASQGIAKQFVEQTTSLQFSSHVVLFARREGWGAGFHEKIFCTVVLTLSSILSSSVENNINQSWKLINFDPWHNTCKVLWLNPLYTVYSTNVHHRHGMRAKGCLAIPLHTLCARVQTKQIFGLAPWQSVTNLWYSSLRFVLTSKNLISYFNNTLVCYFKFPQKFPQKTSLHYLEGEGQNLIPKLVCILVYHSLECLNGDCSWTVPKNV